MSRTSLIILIATISINIVSAQSKTIYLGKIGYEKTKLVLNSKKEGKVTGQFRVLESDLKFTVDGSIEDNNIQLKILDGTQKKIALLIGQLDGYEIEGSYAKIDGSETQKFEFIEMVIPEMGELKIQESFSGGELNISLPKLINHSIPTVERDFNRKIKEIYSNEYRNAVQEMRETNYEGKISMDLDYTLVEKSPMLISVLMSHFVYFEGAAHGSTKHEVFNYSIKEGKEISEYELMKIINAYGGSLVVLINEELEKIGGCFLENVKGIPIPNISENHLVFTFDSYELGGYVCGNPSVRIPLTSLK